MSEHETREASREEGGGKKGSEETQIKGRTNDGTEN